MFGKYNPPVITDFDNGMRLISIRNELVFASQVGFTFGSRNDPSHFIGMAHACEHLFCRGASPAACTVVLPSDRLPLVSERRTNRMMRRFLGGTSGPNMNVYTVASHTGYGHQDLFAPRHLKHVFPVLAGAVRDGMCDVRIMRQRDDAVICPRAFAVERNAVDNETAENDEWPAMEGYRAALQALYQTNPARYFGDSDPEQLARVKMGTLKQWAQGYYVPGNMCVVVFGPSRNAAVRLIREVGLNTIPAWPAITWDYDHSDDVPVLAEKKHLEFRRAGSKMRHVCLLWPTETHISKDALPLEVLAGLLKDRVEGELREKVTEKGGTYHPLVEWDSSSSHGFITVQFSTKGDDAHCDELIRRTLDVIEELTGDRSDEFEEDVQDGRFFLANAHVEEYRFIPGKSCDRIVSAMANGDDKLARFNAYYEDMMGVSPARVRNAAKKYLHRDRFVLTVVRPAP